MAMSRVSRMMFAALVLFGSLCNRRSTAKGFHDRLTASVPLGWLNYDIETSKRKLGANVICGFTKGHVSRELGTELA
jgi:hypothetical protein